MNDIKLLLTELVCPALPNNTKQVLHIEHNFSLTFKLLNSLHLVCQTCFGDASLWHFEFLEEKESFCEEIGSNLFTFWKSFVSPITTEKSVMYKTSEK